jgi:hypothetical protein
MPRPQINFACSVEDCEKPAHAKGWCRTHWTRMHLYGRLEKTQGLVKGNCTIEGCELPIKAKGLCIRHYQLKRTTGRTEKLERNKTKHPYYAMWFDRRRSHELCEAWLDLYDFAAGIGEKPGDNFVLVKLNSELEYGPDNFKWLEVLKKDEFETDKEWWARKWKDARQRNPDVEYDRNLQRNYGISLDEYLQKFKNQNGVCAICKKEETAINGYSKSIKRLSVDHCHKSTKVRELLCNRCNTTIGLAEDNIELLQNMIDYLKKHGE